jgi:hypothetical protein
MEILLLLVERRGQLVTREDIVARIWGKLSCRPSNAFSFCEERRSLGTLLNVDPAFDSLRSDQAIRRSGSTYGAHSECQG